MAMQSHQRTDIVFVWRDKNVDNSYNSSIFGSDVNVVYATTTTQAIQLINQFKQSRSVYVITNGGDNAQNFVHTVRYNLNINTELAVFCSAVEYHRTWAKNYRNVKVLNGKSNLRDWVNKIKKEHAAIQYFQRALNLNVSNERKDNDDTDEKIATNIKGNMNKNGLKTEDFQISNKFDLKFDDKLKKEGIRDESGYNLIPMTSKPVVSFTLNQSYDTWTPATERQFLTNLARELGVKPEQLSIICRSQGSVNLAVLVDAVVSQYTGVPITCAYIEHKTRSLHKSSSLKPYCIQSTEIKDWFNKKLNDNTINIMQNVNAPNGRLALSKTEQWILKQTKALKSSLEMALSKLKDKYVVSAICMLDNDDAFAKFMQHSDVEKSKLLFHGTNLEALGSIYQTGLRHGGGAVYGHGSYLTSSPLHSINYMMCYKTGVSATGAYTLIAAYVNCGNIKEIYDASYNQKQIAYGYDTHYIAKVASAPNKRYLGYPMAYIQRNTGVKYKGEVADEYAVKEVTRILPRFYITLSKVDDELNNYRKNEPFIKRGNYNSDSLCFHYKIKQLSFYKYAHSEEDHMPDFWSKYKHFGTLNIHPLLWRKAFCKNDITNMFDTRGYEHNFQEMHHFVGPRKDLKQKYIAPKGWTRYGLNVMGKYSDDSWLHPFQQNNKQLWWRAYHGTINSKVRGRGNCIDAMAKIYKNGFMKGETPCALGKGVYCSPDPNIIEQHGYCGIATICIKNAETKTVQELQPHGTLRTFKFMLQVAVRPSSYTLSKNSNALYWCVENEDDIRVYGILIKEIEYEKKYQGDYYKVPLGMDSCFGGGVMETYYGSEKVKNIAHGDVFYDSD
eukprot:2024_1